MRGLKSIVYIPHPNPLPEGEGIFRGFPFAIQFITAQRLTDSRNDPIPARNPAR